MKTKNKEVKQSTPEVVTEDKTSKLGKVMVRISPENAEYVPMKNDDGWFIAAGAPRVPELHKDIRLLLSRAVGHGCALFATAGGIRVLEHANGQGGVFFVEKVDAQKGEKVFLFSPADKPSCEKAGLVVLRESKGVYVAPRTKEGELILDILMSQFKNNRTPMNFVAHPWEGYKVEMPEKKAKKVKAEKAPAEKKVATSEKAPVKTPKTPEQKKSKKEAKTPTEEKQAASA